MAFGSLTPPRSTGNESIPTTRQPPSGAAHPSALRDRIAPLVGELRLEIGDQQISDLVGLADLIARWGARINLSAHRTAVEIFEHLILDALALGAAVLESIESWPREVVDLGSGAGIPGLPLAIAFPGSRFQLVEARERRHHFQRAACRKLALENVETRLGRIEILEPSAAPLVFAQAVGPIRQVVSLAAPWIRPGGWLAVPSGAVAPRFDPGPAWVDHETRPYRTPGMNRDRTVWIGRRSLAAAESA